VKKGGPHSPFFHFSSLGMSNQSIKNQDLKKYISLKEAAKISGYAPDYIGYLIRTGKIPGKIVYTGISWQTTAQAVLDYKNRQQKKKVKEDFKDKVFEKIEDFKRKIAFEFSVLKMFFKEFKVLLIAFFLLIFLISGISVWLFSSKMEKKTEIKETEKQEKIIF